MIERKMLASSLFGGRSAKSLPWMARPRGAHNKLREASIQGEAVLFVRLLYRRTTMRRKIIPVMTKRKNGK